MQNTRPRAWACLGPGRAGGSLVFCIFPGDIWISALRMSRASLSNEILLCICVQFNRYHIQLSFFHNEYRNILNYIVFSNMSTHILITLHTFCVCCDASNKQNAPWNMTPMRPGFSPGTPIWDLLVKQLHDAYTEATQKLWDSSVPQDEKQIGVNQGIHKLINQLLNE